MANQFSKKNIDFDVYERQDPASTVDWGKAAKDIADSFQGVVDEREKRKGELNKAFQNQQQALNDIGEYDNPTIQQFVMNGGQDAANKNLDFYNLMKRGLVKPEDYEMFQHNQKTGFDLMKKNAANFDKRFQEYTARIQDGTGAPGEEWIGKQLEGFAKLNNMVLESDPETGNMVMLKLDEDGNPIPDSSMSVQHMTLMMEQKIDNFDIGKATTNIKNDLGKIITSQFRLDGITGEITKTERSRAEAEFLATKDGKRFLELKAQQMIDNPYDKQSMMINAQLTTEDGTTFEIGSQQEYDEWNKANPGNEKNNPYLVMAFGEDNVYKPKFNEYQTKIAEKYAQESITSSLDVKQTKTVQKIERAQPTPASIRGGQLKEQGRGAFTTLRTFIKGTGPDAKAAGDELAIMYNKNVKEGQRKMRRIDRMANGQFRVIYTEGEDDILGDPNGSVKNAERALYAVIQAGTDMPQLYDSALREFDLSTAEGDVTLDDPLSGFTQQAESTYTPGLVAVLEDGKYVNKKLSEVSKNIKTGGFFRNAKPDQLVANFTELINTPGFLPATFKTDLKRIGQAVEMYENANGNAEFRIVDLKTGNTVQSGGEDLVITMDKTYVEANNGEDVATQIQELVKKKNADINKRFNRSDKNFPPYKEWIKENQGKNYTDYLNAKRAN